MISIVVPVYNEEESLPLLMKSVDETLSKMREDYEIIFVDDGSSDNSFVTCRALYIEYAGKVKVFRLNRNYGKSAALNVGIGEANGDIIMTMDSDLQDDPAAIPDLKEKLDEGWDLVSGWKKKRYDPITKTLPSKIFNFITSIMSGLKLHDFNCGFKAYKAAAAKDLEIYGERHRYLPALAYWDGYKVTEVPVPHHPRKFGKSKFGASRFINGLMDMLTLIFLNKYLKNPLHLFGTIGLLLFITGSAVLGYFGVNWVITGKMHIRPLILLAVGSIIMSIQFISLGLLGELITNYSSNKMNYKVRETLN